MTKPLTEEIAKEYGFGKRNFTEWARDYLSSLKVGERVDDIKPIKFWERGRRGGGIAKEFEKYIIGKFQTDFGPMLKLNPNHIYILKESANDSGYHFYIPVVKTFRHNTLNEQEINGLFNQSRPTFTPYGFDYLNRNIIGILDFAPSTTFMNWGQNPLEVK